MAKNEGAQHRGVAANDTIVAIATPLGEGGLGVVRLSGPKALEIASRFFSIPLTVPSHTLHHGWITDGNKAIDEVVAGVFRTPRSYTGEDTVEFSCHGGPALLKKIVGLCQREGARLAKPGEFTERAYLNGKLDLAQAEAVAELIHANSTASREAAADQLRGVLSDRIRAIRSKLLVLLAHIEANLDFAEEDIPGLPIEEMRSGLQAAHAELSSLLSTTVRGRMVRDGLRMVLAGRPNVGKSSLFNALLARDRAIVTDIPGTTRDTLEERLEWEGFSILLTDTAGLRDNVDQVEEKGRERAKRAQESAEAILFVVDGHAGFTQEDDRLLRTLAQPKTVVVFNKMDLKFHPTMENFTDRFREYRSVSVSAKEGTSLAELKTMVVDTFLSKAGVLSREGENTPVVTSLRHKTHLENCLQKVADALQRTSNHGSEETIALDIRAALDELGAITGENVTSDVLDAIFRRFCIGK